MKIYTTFIFDRSLRKQKISDEKLCEIAQEIIDGLVDAKLGANIYKKRIPLGNGGKRSGARTVVAYHHESHLFFMDGWTKADVPDDGTKEITDDDIESYRLIAHDLLSASEEHISKDIAEKRLREVKCHEQIEAPT